MQKRAIQTLDVTIDDNGHIMIAAGDLATIKTGVQLPTSITSGTKAGAADGAQLVAEATPCKGVWFGAPETAGVATNASPVYVGGAGVGVQNIPIMPENFEGIYIPIDDASKLYVRSAAGESVQYAIYS